MIALEKGSESNANASVPKQRLVIKFFVTGVLDGLSQRLGIPTEPRAV